MQNEPLQNKLSVSIQAIHISLYSSSNFHISPSQFASDHEVLSTHIIMPQFLCPLSNSHCSFPSPSHTSFYNCSPARTSNSPLSYVSIPQSLYQPQHGSREQHFPSFSSSLLRVLYFIILSIKCNNQFSMKPGTEVKSSIKIVLEKHIYFSSTPLDTKIFFLSLCSLVTLFTQQLALNRSTFRASINWKKTPHFLHKQAIIQLPQLVLKNIQVHFQYLHPCIYKVMKTVQS